MPVACWGQQDGRLSGGALHGGQVAAEWDRHLLRHHRRPGPRLQPQVPVTAQQIFLALLTNIFASVNKYFCLCQQIFLPLLTNIFARAGARAWCCRCSGRSPGRRARAAPSTWWVCSTASSGSRSCLTSSWAPSRRSPPAPRRSPSPAPGTTSRRW